MHAVPVKLRHAVPLDDNIVREQSNIGAESHRMLTRVRAPADTQYLTQVLVYSRPTQFETQAAVGHGLDRNRVDFLHGTYNARLQSEGLQPGHTVLCTRLDVEAARRWPLCS